MTKKKISPREIIEKEEDPGVEHAYIKFPGKNIESIGESEKPRGVAFNTAKMRKLWENNSRRSYTEIHTHPYEELGVKDKAYLILPSSEDVELFLLDDTAKTAIIAQTDLKTGKLYGYFVLRKTKNTPKSGYSQVNKHSLVNMLKDFFQGRNIKYKPELKKDLTSLRYSHMGIEKSLSNFAEKYHLHYRFVPEKDYKFYIPPQSVHKKGLEEKISAAFALIGLGGAIVFLSSNLTGNVVGNLNRASSNWIGVIFLLISVVSGFYWLKKRF